MENFDDKYKKKNPFTVPEGYFEGLTDQVMEKVEKKKKAVEPKIGRTLKSYLGLAAIFVLALMVVQVLYPMLTDEERGQREERTEEMAQVPEAVEEDIFDSYFNPTSDEIIEYLATEVDNYDLMYAGIY